MNRQEMWACLVSSQEGETGGFNTIDPNNMVQTISPFAKQDENPFLQDTVQAIGKNISNCTVDFPNPFVRMVDSE